MANLIGWLGAASSMGINSYDMRPYARRSECMAVHVDKMHQDISTFTLVESLDSFGLSFPLMPHLVYKKGNTIWTFYV